VQPPHAIRQPRQIAEDLAEDNSPVRARLLDDAGRDHGRRNVRRPAKHGTLADDRRQLLRALDAVLDAQHCRVIGEHRRDQRKRGAVVVRLHRDDHDIDRADTRRVFLCARPNDEVTERRAADLETACANRGQMRAARDQRDIVTSVRQSCTVVATNSA